MPFTGKGAQRFDKSHKGETHLSHITKKDDSHQLLLCSAMDAIHPCLPSHGSAGQMSDRCFKVHHNGPFYDRGSSFIHAYTLSLKLLPSYTAFYTCPKDALAGFSLLAALCKLVLCQLKLEVHQQVTFSNIRLLSEWKYAAAWFNSDYQPTTLTYSSPSYLQPGPYTKKGT